MPVSLYSRKELEEKFEKRYVNKSISLTYPGYKPVVGKVDIIAFDHKGDLIIQMNNRRYQVSLECIDEMIKLLR